jgi:isoleucyl-tRNA synthetase
MSELEEFVVNIVSRQYIPVVRRELWTDAPETLNRRLAVYATLWHVLKTLTFLFNPVTPYLSEAMYQRVYKQLDKTLPESVNFEDWPKPDKILQDEALEQEFENLMQCVSLVYSARQNAQLKRRWPLQKVMVVAPKKAQNALKNLEEAFLELANVKKIEYLEEAPEETDDKRWVLALGEGMQVLLDTSRDESLLGEGVMRDLARRVQALRKELGFMPTDILNCVHVAELDSESVRLLKPYLNDMAELVRTKKVNLHKKRSEVKAEWKERRLDGKKIYVAIE